MLFQLFHHPCKLLCCLTQVVAHGRPPVSQGRQQVVTRTAVSSAPASNNRTVVAKGRGLTQVQQPQRQVTQHIQPVQRQQPQQRPQVEH